MRKALNRSRLKGSIQPSGGALDGQHDMSTSSFFPYDERRLR